MTLRTIFTLAQAATFVALAALLITEGGPMNYRLAFAQGALALITVAVYL